MERIDPSRITEQDVERAARFVKSFDDSRKELFKLSDQGANNLRGLVADFKAEVSGILKFFRPGGEESFLSRITPQIAAEINVAMRDLIRMGGGVLTSGFDDAFFLGQGVTANAMRAAGIQSIFPSVSPEILITLSNNSFDIFTETGNALQARIARALRIGSVGFQPASLTIRSIEDMISKSVEVRAGLRRRIGFTFQAEEIARTEMGRIFSNAQQLASEQMADTIPGLRKKWITSGGILTSRAEHKEVEKNTAEGGPIGPIPIRSRFVVSDRSRTGTSNFLTLGGRHNPPQGAVPGLRVVRPQKSFTRRGRLATARMLFPRDPIAGPGFVVNCRCTVMDVLPELEQAQNQALGIIQQGEL